MKIAAIGDAHLGRSYYTYTTAEGINQRERDFEISFEAAIDLALDQNPDVVVWLGDIFDHPRPSFRSYRIAQKGLAKLREGGVYVVVISGNHDTPRLPGTGSPYSPLSDSFMDMNFAYRLSYEKFELADLVVHAVPQTLNVEAALDELAKAKSNYSKDKINLLITHPRLKQLEPSHSDINEIEIDENALSGDFVLLGHYHFFSKVKKNIWYAGATDTFSFADDPDRPKGIVVLDTGDGTCSHIPIPNQRPLITLDDIQANGLSPKEIQDILAQRSQDVIEGAIVRIFLSQVDPGAFRLLDLDEARRNFGWALHLQLEANFEQENVQVDLPEQDTIHERWLNYLSAQDLVGYERDLIVQKGSEYLSNAVEQA